MTDDEFREAVQDALDSLPPEIASQLTNVAVIVEDAHQSGRILGLFDPTARGNVAVKALARFDVDAAVVERLVDERVPKGPEPVRGHIPFTARAKKVLELALREALRLGHNYIGCEHVLLALRREDQGVAAKILAERGVDRQQLEAAVRDVLTGAE